MTYSVAKPAHHSALSGMAGDSGSDQAEQGARSLIRFRRGGRAPLSFWEETAQPAALFLRGMKRGIHVAWYAETGWSR